MIQDIAPHVYDNAFSHRREPLPEDFVFICPGEKEILVKDTPEGFRFPTVAEVGAPAEALKYCFLVDDRAFFAGPADWTAEGFELKKQPWLRTAKPQHLGFAGITGLQLIRWFRSQTYCGCCGTKLEPSTWERAFVCPNCHKTTYPKLMPAVTIAVMNGDKMVVSTSVERPNSSLANIAGFVEIGESFEDCVHREVREEIGLEVKNIRYYKSQPWSFSDTVMIGFFCDLDGDDTLHVDPNELKAARWISREEMPVRAGEPALTAEMQELFRLGKEPAYYG